MALTENEVIKEAIKLPYKSDRIVINRANIAFFMKMDRARPVSPKHVNEIYRAISQGLPLLSPIAVNKLDREHFTIIDGHHRIEAISRKIEEDPTFQIMIEVLVFEHLLREEETRVFNILNNVLPQSTSSMLWVNRDDYPAINLMLKNFPLHIMASSTSHGTNVKKNSIGLTMVLIPYLSLGKPFRIIRREDILKEAKKLDRRDYENLYAFMSGYITAFGMPEDGNRFYRTRAFALLLRIYFANVNFAGLGGTLEEQEIILRFQKLIDSPSVRDVLNSASSQGSIGPALRIAEDVIISALNKGRRTSKFVSPSVVWDSKEEGSQ